MGRGWGRGRVFCCWLISWGKGLLGGSLGALGLCRIFGGLVGGDRFCGFCERGLIHMGDGFMIFRDPKLETSQILILNRREPCEPMYLLDNRLHTIFGHSLI
jgi:hypothetical protein